VTGERFLGRVYKMSALVFLVVLSGLVAYRVRPSFIWGYAIGYFVALFSLLALDLVINRVFAPGGTLSRAKYGAITAAKYVLVAGIIYWVVRSDYISVVGFVVGFGLIQLVIALKAMGSILAQGRSRTQRPAGGE
jgi:hypothetical protein